MASIANDITGVLTILRSESDEELAPLFQSFDELYERKLWHQLTEKLTVFYKNDKSKTIRVRLFNNFIEAFKFKINQLKLVEFLLLSVKELEDDQESLNYLTSLQNELVLKQDLDKEQALLFIKIEIARFKLRLGESLESREILDNIDEELTKLDSIELKLNQSYYSTNAEYYKLKSDYNNFYYQSLLFLSTIKIEELDLIEQQKISYELSIAALLGDKIYNFGELLTHPVLKSLSNDSNPYNWLVELLESLNSGNINNFSKLLSNLNKIPILQNSESFLRQKICLMTLIELVFSQTIRIISFEDVAKATLLNSDEVEHLVMRALSLGLLKGSIDQINQLITINWVQPRIINQKQIEQMKKKLIEWDSNVSKLGEFMESNGKEIWIQ